MPASLSARSFRIWFTNILSYHRHNVTLWVKLELRNVSLSSSISSAKNLLNEIYQPFYSPHLSRSLTLESIYSKISFWRQQLLSFLFEVEVIVQNLGLGPKRCSSSINSYHVLYLVKNHSGYALIILNPIKHCCSFIKHY